MTHLRWRANFTEVSKGDGREGVPTQMPQRRRARGQAIERLENSQRMMPSEIRPTTPVRAQVADQPTMFAVDVAEERHVADRRATRGRCQAPAASTRFQSMNRSSPLMAFNAIHQRFSPEFRCGASERRVLTKSGASRQDSHNMLKAHNNLAAASPCGRRGLRKSVVTRSR